LRTATLCLDKAGTVTHVPTVACQVSPMSWIQTLSGSPKDPPSAPFAAGVVEASDQPDPVPQVVPGLPAEINRVVCIRRTAAVLQQESS
jgi:hypothetical protein